MSPATDTASENFAPGSMDVCYPCAFRRDIGDRWGDTPPASVCRIHQEYMHEGETMPKGACIHAD